MSKSVRVWAPVLCVVAVIGIAAANGFCQYTAIDLYTLRAPEGFVMPAPSVGNATAADGQVVGSASVPGQPQHPFLWNRTSTPIDLTPAGSPFAWINVLATSGTQQVGEGVRSGGNHALMWNGSADSMVDLTPDGAGSATCIGTNGVQQVGVVFLNGTYHAFAWTGTAQSALDLGLGVAKATDGNEQVGADSDVGNGRACLWRGSAASQVILHPADFTLSEALGVSGAEQVGQGWGPPTGGQNHALLWHGSAQSAVDLHPSQLGLTGSEALTTNGSIEGGYGIYGDSVHALLWHGTAASAIDLNFLLSSNFTASEATSIDANGNVFGIAEAVDGSWHAVEWAVPEPFILPCLGLAMLLARSRRVASLARTLDKVG